MARELRLPLAGGALVALAAIATPAAAAEAPRAPLVAAAPAAAFDHSRFDPADARADWRCRGWGGCGWGGGWGRRGWGGGWRRNRIDAGDVLIGAAILGGVIAIASSANRRQRERDVVVVERDRDWRDRDWRDDDRRFDDRRVDDRRFDSPRSSGGAGLSSAVDQCLAAVERDVRVGSVEDASRTGAGWVVSGTLFNGSPFQCRIGNDGRIDGIDYGGFSGGGLGANGFVPGSAAPAETYSTAPRADGQWSDARYADARLAMGGFAQPQATGPAPVPAFAGAAPMPAYPGGPIPGEVIPETIDGDLAN